jgi:UDP-glucuronate decarboxylase
MRSTISPVRRRRSISNSIRCRRRRPACGDPEIHPQPETYWGRVNPIGYRACYDEGKGRAETLFFDYHRQHRLETKVVRIFNTYGPRMHPNDGRAVSNFVVQALKVEDITIYGDGSQTRAFCYVDDLVDAMLRMRRTDPEITGPVNIGNPGEFSIRELADLVHRADGNEVEARLKAAAQDDPKQRRPDISLAKKVLGWEPKVELRQDLVNTIYYFDAFLSEEGGKSKTKARSRAVSAPR